MEDFFNQCGLVKKKESFAELLRKIETGRESYLQMHIRSNSQIVPIEIAVYPIQVGVLKGGFVILFWE